MKINRIWIVRLALVVLSIVALSTAVFAAGNRLTVKPLTTDTDEIWPNQTIYVCQITGYDGTEHHLTEGFANSHLSISALLGENVNKYAPQIRDYAIQNGIATLSGVTDNGGIAAFNDLENGIYLVYPKDEALFLPFVIVIDGTDIDSEPKVEPPDPPDPTEPTDPTDPTKPTEPKPTEPQPTKPVKPTPPYTGDDSPVALYTAGLIIGLAGLAICAILPLRKRKKNGRNNKSE